MGAPVEPAVMRVGLPIITINGIVAMVVLMVVIFYTLYNFRSEKYFIERDIRRSSLSVFYSSFLLAFVQVLLWSGIFTDESDCTWIVKINAITLHITKMCLYYLYTVRLDYTFRDTDWELPPIILFFIRIAIVLVFGIVAVIMIVEIHHGPTLETAWGLYCNIQLSTGILVVYGTIDLAITVYLLYLFVSKLLQVSQKVGSTLSKQDNVLYHLVRLISILTILSIVSSWVMIVGYIFWKPMSWITTLDATFNSVCVFLMFEFVHLIDRIRFAGIRCCLCQCLWTKESRYEYNKHMNALNKQSSKDISTNATNNDNKNNNKNKNDNKNDNNENDNGNGAPNTNDIETPRQGPQIVTVKTSSQNGSNQTNSKRKQMDNERNENETNNHIYDSKMNENERNDNNNNIVNVSKRRKQGDKDVKSKNYTTTSDLELDTKNDESNVNNNAEWTMASDVNTLDTEIENSGLVEGESTKLQNQYAMEIMKLHANIDQF